MKRQLIYHTSVELGSKAFTTNNICEKREQDIHEHARINKISRHGLSVTCDQETLNRLLPNTSSVSPKQPVKLEISFKLESFLQVAANVIYLRRLSKDTFQLELNFDGLDSTAEEEIDKYIENALYKGKEQHITEILELSELHAVA